MSGADSSLIGCGPDVTVEMGNGQLVIPSAARSGFRRRGYFQRSRISFALVASAACRNGPKLMRATPSGPNDAGSS